MVIAAPPPVDPAGQVMTFEQQVDLDCLTLAKALQGLPAPPLGKRNADAMVRVFSDRLMQSDPSRNWAAITPEGSSVMYGWFMGQLQSCPARVKQPSVLPLLGEDSVRSSVWLDADDAQLLAKIEDGPKGYRLVVDCVRGCIPRTRYVQDISDSPISLFRLGDGDDLLFSIWAGGSAYRVRVWKLSRGGVVQLLKASSRGRPDFVSTDDGAPAVRTYEADSGLQDPHPMTWEYRNGNFTRGSENRR
jgi:hypothetical protein